METKNDEFQPVFPVELRHLEQPLRETQAEIQMIDAAIARLPKDKGLRMDLVPPGGKKVSTYKQNWVIREGYEKDKAILISNFAERVLTETSRLDPKVAEKVQGALAFHLGNDRNYYKSEEKFKELNGTKKSLDRSSHYKMALLAREHVKDSYAKLNSEQVLTLARESITPGYQRYVRELASRNIDIEPGKGAIEPEKLDYIEPERD